MPIRQACRESPQRARWANLFKEVTMGLFRRTASNGRHTAWRSFALIGMLLLFLLPGNAFGQLQSLADLVEKVKHCVVNLSTTQIIRTGRSHPEMNEDDHLRDFFGNDFFNRFFGGIPRERRTTALGSGVIISSDGLILTNHHVVERATEIKVRLDTNKEYDAKLVGSDPKTDLALIRVKPDKDFPKPARLGNSDTTRVGSEVMAVGNPYGLGNTVTSGIVSAKGRIIGAGPYDNFLQTDAAINPGNSGGPLFNMKGEVIGINTAIVAQAQGIGFAIPINLAVELLPQLKKGKVIRGWLGVMIQDLTPDLADSLGLKDTKGVLVSDVIKGAPADKAGLKRGDVIVQVNGKGVAEAHSLSRMIAAIKPGSEVDVSVIRNGGHKTIPVTLGTLPEESPSVQRSQEEQMPQEQWGMTVQTLTSNLARHLGLPSDEKGVVIVQIEPGSPASQSGLLQGDLIKEVDRKPVNNLADFNAIIHQNNKDHLLLLIKRGRGTLYIVLKK
jgi:serine protease Do